MQWTDKQRQVIETGGSNLLVSAAAGSGKTAVLVERILRLITEGENPADIDRLLVMTFTKSAAVEMKERIALAVEKKLAEQPGNAHLQLQAALVPHAPITTIDSFCLSLVREHFDLLEIDPAFRVGDEGELTLLRADVMERMLEEYYEKGDPEFEQFADIYGAGKSDRGIEDVILQVYEFAQSNPFPEDWFADCRHEQEILEKGDLMGTRWAGYLMRDLTMRLEELSAQYETAIAICSSPDGPEVYLPVLYQELEMISRLKKSQTYDEVSEGLREFRFERLAAARGKNLDPEKKEQAAEIRNHAKKIIKDLQKAYGQESREEAVADLLGTKKAVLELLTLAEDYSNRYREAKRDKNLVDFNDLEHYALAILAEKKDGEIVFTRTADRVSSQYEEILVDEYQDSNYVQEMLIRSISGERFGRPNVFLVGDVKQSIYRFRLARPELFMEKYDTYTTEAGANRKIELNRNFRSRAEVLDSANCLFRRIMTKQLGNVEYTEDAALHAGAVFAKVPESFSRTVDNTTEICLMNIGKDSESGSGGAGGPGGAADLTARELEAKMAAERIRRLTDPEGGLPVWDGKRECYRRAGYGDIVILLRSMAGWSDVFVRVLTMEGIPAYADTTTGYFNTIEVETVLAMLAVIDNPMQDIPLAAVLRSPIVGMTDEELASMMAEDREPPGGQTAAGGTAAPGEQTAAGGTAAPGEQTAAGGTAAPGGQTAAGGTAAPGEQQPPGAQDRGICGAFRRQAGRREKLRRFAEMLETLRDQAAWMPIHQLLYQIYETTGYYDYVSAMPAGEVRRANLDMLVEKAAAYEKTSYKGLFQFIRYINLLKKYDTDFGEASASGRYEDMVRIMSIHKSKGLEFPVVILSGVGKPFNRQDSRGRLVIDPDLGIGTDYLDLERRTRTATLKKQVLKRKIDADNLGEELRVLYVAMTRAKEKLILTGTDRSLEKKLEKWRAPFWETLGGEKGEPRPVPYTALTSASSFLDWILMAQTEQSGSCRFCAVSADSLAGQETVRRVRSGVSKEALLSLDRDQVQDEEWRAEIENRFSYRYPYEADVDLPAKMTVSELKRLGQRIDDAESRNRPEEAEYLGKTPYSEKTPFSGKTPSFEEVPSPEEAPSQEKTLRDDGSPPAYVQAARRGTAYHRVLELLDFSDTRSEKDVQAQLDRLREQGKITGETGDAVAARDIWLLAASPLGQRIREADQRHVFRREQPFIMLMTARELGLRDSEEPVLVQGTIDACFEEKDGLVLVDYKTDRIAPDEEKVLAERYRPQMDYYQRALEQITGKQVKERIIYSVCLQKEIPV